MPLGKIATFIYKQLGLTHGVENHPYVILPVWEQIYAVAHGDPFYGQKSLATIANHIQEFFQKTAYGDRKTTKLSPDKLKRKIAAKYLERKKGTGDHAPGEI